MLSIKQRPLHNPPALVLTAEGVHVESIVCIFFISIFASV